MTAPGWYPDGAGRQRWWDGSRWTEHVQPPATPWQPPTRTDRRRRAPALWLSALLVVVGVGAVVGAFLAGLPSIGASLDGPRLTAPGQRTVELDEGPWTMFERTGTTSGGGGFTFTRNDEVTFGPEQVHVAGPTPVAVRSDIGQGSTETLNRGGRLYTGAVRLDVGVRGTYSISVDDTGAEPREVILARPVSYALRQWKPLVVLGLGVVAGVTGLVLLVVGVRSRRLAAASGQ